jgi:hypothetical protein
MAVRPCKRRPPTSVACLSVGWSSWPGRLASARRASPCRFCAAAQRRGSIVAVIDADCVAADPPTEHDVRKLLVRAGRRVIAPPRWFFVDDKNRQRELDGLLASLEQGSAPPAPSLFPCREQRAPLSAFLEGISLHPATALTCAQCDGQPGPGLVCGKFSRRPRG